MLGMNPIKDAGRAAEYFGKSDGGYYLDGSGLRREWGGEAASPLGLTGKPEFEQFKRLLHGLDPHTGKQLTAMLTEDRLAGLGLHRQPAQRRNLGHRGRRSPHRAGVLVRRRNEAMEDVERYATTRVRKGGKDADRVTGNMALARRRASRDAAGQRGRDAGLGPASSISSWLT